MFTPSEIDSTASATEENPFQNLGEFDWIAGEGPARSLPDELRALQLGLTWTGEFNEPFEPDGFTKNHITSRVRFSEPYFDEEGMEYPGAKISMELSRTLFRVIDNGEVSA